MGWLGRAHATGTVAEPLDDVLVATRRIATEHGLTLDEAASSARSMTFTRSVKPWSRGAEIVVEFEPLEYRATRVSVSAKEPFAISDWGRGRRVADTFLDGLAAHRPISWSH